MKLLVIFIDLNNLKNFFFNNYNSFFINLKLILLNILIFIKRKFF